MIRTLLLLFLYCPLQLSAQQTEKPVRLKADRTHAPFGPLAFRNDSITIAGVYKNYHHAAGDLFKVTYYDWISSKTVHHTTAIDSSGRFYLRIPLPAETDLSLDDARIDERSIAIPGETIRFEADLATYPTDGKDAGANMIRFYGENARLHHEIHQFYQDKKSRKLPDYTNSEWYGTFPTPEALSDTMNTVFHSNLRYLADWQRKNKPEARTMQYLRAHISYEAIMPMTQILYNYGDRKSHFPDEAYYRRIDSMIAINGNTGHLSQYFIVVHRDFRNSSEDKSRKLKLDKDSLYQAHSRHPLEKELTDIWFAARWLTQGQPIGDKTIAELRGIVKDTLLLQTLVRRNEDFKKLMADEKLLAGTRIVTQFPALQSADDILAHITAPYRGKVIYLDIWGTWCSPCREMMQYMPDIKKAYAGKDVVFIYMANQSPEAVWKKTILEHKITGPAVAHLLLPDAMQQVFEKKYRTTGFPCYILIGKDGTVATTEAPWPREASALHAAIGKLL